ncbi:MAG: endonuclease V [Polyangiaceae bacterium]|nr:endonuclease V [Polyangiaceae bacterium]MCB9606915.1 endonuclease V [Polyangiaceae bacterium]
MPLALAWFAAGCIGSQTTHAAAMLLALDVQYDTPRVGAAAVGLVGFDAWDSSAARFARRLLSDARPGDYQAGAFYKRELPYLLEAVRALPVAPSVVLVDGHVWLDAEPSGQPRPGLGAHLHQALEGRVPVVGIAKNAFARACCAVSVVRGTSAKPLFVTSAGYELDRAADGVRQMHGAHRIPTLIKLADQLARGHARTRETQGALADRNPTS